MKRSTKIFIALVLLVLLILIGQAVISDQVIDDSFRLESGTDSVAKYEVLKNSGSIREYPCQPFKNIRLKGDNLKVSFLKAEKSGLFVNKYVSDWLNFSFSGDTLIIGEISRYVGEHIYVSVQEEPERIIINSSSYSNLDFSGFNGKNMKIIGQNGSGNIGGDLEYVNIDLDKGYISHRSDLNDSVKKIDEMQLNVRVKDGTFSYYSYYSSVKTMSAKIVLDHGNLDFQQCNEAAPSLKKLEVSGFASNESNFLGYICVSRCDSLIISLVGDSMQYSSFKLSGSGMKYEDIQLSGKINMERHSVPQQYSY